MAKRVFFSFHYQDVIDFRANVVRNHKTTKHESAGYFDASIWEDAKRTSDLALKRLINDELQNTTVTCVLVGTHTFERRWVDYEIMRSLWKGNKIIAVHINGIKGRDGRTKEKGNNPLSYLGYSYSDDGKKVKLYKYKHGSWTDYTDLDGWTINQVDEKYRGKSYKLSDTCQIYDWINNNGYNNFASWIE